MDRWFPAALIAMKVVCAWCNKTLSPGEPDDTVSHGICPDCAEMVLRQRQVPLLELLNQFDVPVIALDADVSALCANQAAEKAMAIKWT